MLFSNLLKYHRYALAHAYAHGAQGAFMAVESHFMSSGEGEARAGHSERVTQRYSATIGVHVICIIGQTQRAQDRQALGSESFVELNHIYVRHL
tara:strand:- start:26 stop:307 length:282 start_codon:yes stop_codon:yes gene_type:complete